MTSSFIEPTENMFAGSLIATEDRPTGMLSHLRIMEMAPNWLESEWPRTIFAAAIRADDRQWQLLPTPENLALVIQQEKLKPGIVVPSEPDKQAEQLQFLADEIRAYVELGTNNPNALNSLAAAIRMNVGNKRLFEYGRQAAQLTGNSSLTPYDKYAELLTALESARPDTIEAKIYTVKDQIRLMDEMREKQRRLLGTKLITLPSEWGLAELVPYVLPGFLVTLTGLTGHGKSSVMTQWADFLSAYGFRVLYLHLEDSIERQIDRQTRRMTRATGMELFAGDPRDKYSIVKERLKSRKEASGGEVIYGWCPSVLPSTIRSIVQAYKPDVVFVDYLQKINVHPYLKLAGGNAAAAWSNVVEDLKQIAENDKHNCVVVMGSQDAEHDPGSKFRKGTSNTRDAERKAQLVIEIEGYRLTEDDEPEQAKGESLSKAGKLSIFRYMNVVKYNDGDTGSSVGMLLGPIGTFKARSFRQWERKHPGESMAAPVLEEPGQAYYDRMERRLRAMEDIDLVMDDPKTRNKKKKEAGRAEAKAQRRDDPIDGDEHVPF